MNWRDPYFLTLFITGFSFVLVGFFTLRFPPKKISNYYGYRSKRAMSSQEAWDFSQNYSSYEFLKWGLIGMIFSFLGLFWSLQETLSMVVGIIAIGVMTLIPFLNTEKQLKERFQD